MLLLNIIGQNVRRKKVAIYFASDDGFPLRIFSW